MSSSASMAPRRASRRSARRGASPTPRAPPLLGGKPVPSIIGLARRFEATLIAVGPHGRSRLGGIAVGRVATAMLHDAPCSVLLARAPGAPGSFPRAIVAGVDGSALSLDALRVAAEIAARLRGALGRLAA